MTSLYSGLRPVGSGRLVACGGLAASVLGMGPGASPARAECVYAEVYVTREGDTPIWVVGENDPCIYPTPWTWAVTEQDDATSTNLPPGTPNGYYYDIRVPIPV